MLLLRVCRTTVLLGLGVVVSLPHVTSRAAPAAAPAQDQQEHDDVTTSGGRHRRIFVTPLPHGDEPTIAVSKISARGTVVGAAMPDGNVLRWRRHARAPENLGGAQTFVLLNRVPLISDDGSVIAITRYLEDPQTQESHGTPSIWTSRSGWQPLPGLALRESSVSGMSRNGQNMAGHGWVDSMSWARPWAWTRRGGQRMLEVSPEMAGAEAWAIADDGRVVVGAQFTVPNPPSPWRQFYATRWSADGMRIMTDQSGTPLGQAFSCSRDCSVAIGGGQGGEPDFAHPNWGQAWYWTRRTGGVYLGALPDAAPGTTYYATDLSGDGSLIIGTYYVADDDGGLHYRGWVWTARTGMIPIVKLLAAHGIDHGSDWRSLVPTAITSRGDMILIAGLQADLTTGGFVIHLPRRSHRGGPFDATDAADETDASNTSDTSNTSDASEASEALDPFDVRRGTS